MLAASNAVYAHDISASQTGVIVTDEASKAKCVQIAHQVCDQVIGSCTKNHEAAIGGPYGYQIMYQCHDVKMTRGSMVVLVIAGSRTEDTISTKLNNWIIQSDKLAIELFYHTWGHTTHGVYHCFLAG